MELFGARADEFTLQRLPGCRQRASRTRIRNAGRLRITSIRSLAQVFGDASPNKGKNTMKSALIFGATSAIAQEVAKILAQQGAKLFLVARDEAKLLSIAENLHVLTGHKPDFKEIDFSSTDQIAVVIQQARNKMEGLDMILVAHGTLPDQRICESNPEEALEAMRVNLLSVVAILTVAANEMEQQRRGCIAVISSVAGDRGRQSNYVYGAAKGGLTVFLQ